MFLTNSGGHLEILVTQGEDADRIVLLPARGAVAAGGD